MKPLCPCRMTSDDGTNWNFHVNLVVLIGGHVCVHHIIIGWIGILAPTEADGMLFVKIHSFVDAAIANLYIWWIEWGGEISGRLQQRIQEEEKYFGATPRNIWFLGFKPHQAYLQQRETWMWSFLAKILEGRSLLTTPARNMDILWSLWHIMTYQKLKTVWSMSPRFRTLLLI